MTRRTTAAGVSTIVMLIAILSAGQDRPTYRVATRLVEVSVVVHDRPGRPLAGLTKEDFRLYDGGQEQRIEFFSVHTEASATTAEAAAPAPAPPAADIHEFSNRISGGGGATVILFDRLNTPVQDQVYARRHLINFLRQIRTDDRVGIYVLEGDSIRVLHDFTNDAASLVRAVARYQAMTSKEVAAEESLAEMPGSGDPALDAELAEFLERASAEMTRHFAGLRSNATMTALEAVANHLSGVEGRKNLIWISSGFPIQALAERNTSMTAAIQRATRPLNDANVTLHAVDARGLIGAFTYGPQGRVTMTTLSTVGRNLDILQSVSEETGGRTFYNTNDINGAVRRAVDESRVSYTLGYYPAHSKWDGTYRQITVKVNRPGVEVRHRKGYLAGTGPSSATSKRSPLAAAARSRAIRSALLSPLEATEIGMTARLERVPGTKSDVKVIIKTAPGAIAFEQKGEFREGQVDVVIAQKLADGTAPKSVEKTVELRASHERYQETRTEGLVIDATVTLLPDVQRLHVVVHDVTSGNTGSIVVHADKLRLIARN